MPAFSTLRIDHDPANPRIARLLLKAPVFAFVIASIGVRMGLTVARDTRALGRATTSTVVQGIVAVILLDVTASPETATTAPIAIVVPGTMGSALTARISLALSARLNPSSLNLVRAGETFGSIFAPIAKARPDQLCKALY